MSIEKKNISDNLSHNTIGVLMGNLTELSCAIESSRLEKKAKKMWVVLYKDEDFSVFFSEEEAISAIVVNGVDVAEGCVNKEYLFTLIIDGEDVQLKNYSDEAEDLLEEEREEYLRERKEAREDRSRGEWATF